jgi:phosphatidylethanolamine N-methyltransferase
VSGAAFVGLALVSNSKLVFAAAAFRYLANWWFLSRVEK